MPWVLFCLSWALTTNGTLLASTARGSAKWREIIQSMTKSSCPLSEVFKSGGTYWKAQGTSLRFLMITETWFTSPQRKTSIGARLDGHSTCRASTSNWYTVLVRNLVNLMLSRGEQIINRGRAITVTRCSSNQISFMLLVPPEGGWGLG